MFDTFDFLSEIEAHSARREFIDCGLEVSLIALHPDTYRYVFDVYHR